MTTYELPPEPPVGSRVRDSLGRTWNHPDTNRWSLPGSDSGLPWATILIYSPLTLVESDPWPTAPLIVATANGQRCILHRGSAAYRDIEDFSAYFPESPDTLSNVVPVTVVPIAALPVLWSALEQWLNNANRIPPSEETHRLVGAVESLRGQIDALGVDL